MISQNIARKTALYTIVVLFYEGTDYTADAILFLFSLPHTLELANFRIFSG